VVWISRFDVVGWVTRRESCLQKPVPLISRDSVPEQMKGKYQDGSS